MNILAIDIGTYSIKFIELRPERKSLVLVEKNEVILEEAKTHYPNTQSTQELQKEIVANFIQKQNNELKIVFQVPNEFLTTRYLEIPGTSKRKTEQIIPFQLDDDLPYSLNSAHYSFRLFKKEGGFSVLSNIAQTNAFKDYFTFFESKDAQPTVLTSEISTIQSYLEYIKMNDTCCILDIGHKTTKAYFVQNRQIVSNHTSYTAGSNINEVISKTYQISIEDAIIYKHENAFFLTDNQFENVSTEQKDFALLMKQIFSPLVLDIKRWEIGHRVKFGSNIEKIFIFGGTSQINGFESFLNYHTGVATESLPPISDIKNDYNIHEKNFYLVKMMAVAQRSPQSLINFLTGKFQTASHSFIPVHSAIFIWVRSSFIALLLIAGLFTERYVFLNKQDKTLSAKISGLIKTPSLEINRKDQKSFSTKPENVLNSLKNKNKALSFEINNILKTSSVNALKSLALLSKTVSSNPKISLENFSSDGYNVSATFVAEELNELELMKNHLKSSGLSNLRLKLNESAKSLSIDFSDRD